LWSDQSVSSANKVYNDRHVLVRDSNLLHRSGKKLMKSSVAVSLALLVVALIATGAYFSWHSTSTRLKNSVKGAQVMEHSKESVESVPVRVFNKAGELVGPIDCPKLVLTDAEWHARLTPQQFAILRSQSTERPFCGTLLDNKKKGVYTCAGCGLPLFSSDSKFNSGTGWPSFFQPIAKENVLEHADQSHGMVRVEIVCVRCDGHLGHVFEDGPPPTGLRFCLNSESLEFTPSESLSTLADPIAK
jgi:methionine-R-sulfoxide reductase